MDWIALAVAARRAFSVPGASVFWTESRLQLVAPTRASAMVIA
jgi:hypothetical protein